MKWVGTVSLAALADGALVRLAHPPYDVIVGLVGGEPYAIEDTCNHAGASLTEGGWSLLRPACVVCPMHGYVFSLTSGELISPKGLCDDQRTFRATIEGDQVVVRDPFELAIV